MKKQNSELSDFEAEEDNASSAEESSISTPLADAAKAEISNDENSDDTNRAAVLEIASKIKKTLKARQREFLPEDEDEYSDNDDDDADHEDEDYDDSIEESNTSNPSADESNSQLSEDEYSDDDYDDYDYEDEDDYDAIEESSNKTQSDDGANAELCGNGNSSNETSKAAVDEIVSKIESILKARQVKQPVISQSIRLGKTSGSKLRKTKSAMEFGRSVVKPSTSIALAEIWSQMKSSSTAREREELFFRQWIPFFEPEKEEENVKSQLRKAKSAPNLASFVEETKASIFTFPSRLLNLYIDYHYTLNTEQVPIGPYNKGKSYLWKWEEHKLDVLNNYISRYQKEDLLENLVRQLLRLEQHARACYRGVTVSRNDFVEMMLIDGVFVIELLYHLTCFEGEFDPTNPFCRMTDLLPSDILKLDNQLPYFVLETLFHSHLFPEEEAPPNFRLLALQFFDQAYERPLEILERIDDRGSKHLLDLFHSSLNPLTKASEHSSEATLLCFFNSSIGKNLSKCKGSYGATQNVSGLRSLGVKFKSKKASNFLDIEFENNVLEIPAIEFNVLINTFFVNCFAWERAPGNESKSKQVSDYIYFMACLLKQPSDVAFLRKAGIITGTTYNDEYVSDFLNNLGKEIGYVSTDSYLSQHLTKLQWYCNSPWAAFYDRFMSDPLSSLPTIAVFILIFSLVQTIRAIFRYLQ